MMRRLGLTLNVVLSCMRNRPDNNNNHNHNHRNYKVDELTQRVTTAVVCSSNKKLSCRRETARRFVSLNILLSHSRSLKVIRNDTVEYRACVSSY